MGDAARVPTSGPMRAWLLFGLALGGFVGCGHRKVATSSPPAVAGQNTAPGGGGLPVAVECSFAWRETDKLIRGDDPNDPKFQMTTRTLRVGRDEEGSVALADGVLKVYYRLPEYEVPTVGIRASFGGKETVVLYQLIPPVRNQFTGEHGFTGLVYLGHPTQGGDYQFCCQFAGK